MPATSEKQKKFMDAVAHNKAFATQAGVPQSVGKDFSKASKGLKFGKDRSVATRADRQTINNPKTNQGKQELFKEGGTMATKMNPGFMAMIAKKKAGAKSEMPSKMGKPVMKKGMDTAKDGMKMASGGRTVAKKELEDSGLSLRDFLNKEKGLTRKAPEGMTREYKPRDASSQESKKSMSSEADTSRGSRNFAGSSRGESGGASSGALSRFNAGKEGYDEAGNAMKRGGSVKKMAKGGGVEAKGKTKGKMIKMNMGGKAC